MKKLYVLLVMAVMSCIAANATDWYLVGESYGWADNTNYKFTDNGDGTYSLNVAKLEGQFKIKIEGSWDQQFGSNANNDPIQEGVTYQAQINNKNSANLTVASDINNCLLTINPNAGTILAQAQSGEGEGEGEGTEPTLFVGVAGTFNEWSETANITSDITNNCGVVIIDDWQNGEYGFKVIVNNGGSTSWYSNGSTNVPVDGTWQDTDGGENMKLASEANGKKVKFTIAADNGHFKVEIVEDAEPADPTTYTVTFDNSESGWAQVYCYAWDSSDQYVIATWPGKKMDFAGEDIWTLTFETTLTPAKIKFNNGEGTETSNFDFEDGAKYTSEGKVQVPYTINVDFKAPNTWEDCWAYVWVDNATSAWFHMTKHVAAASVAARAEATTTLYTLTDAECDFTPKGIIFVNQKEFPTGCQQTEDGEFNNNTTYTTTGSTDGEGKLLFGATETGTTGLESVEAEAMQAVYYNLQGVRVANPANGIYIVVRGSNVAKEYIR